MFKRIKEDVQNVKARDPAARSSLEIILTYAGMHALWSYRLAHFFYRHKRFFIARVISQIARFFTLIEIHPAAEIGRRFFIDHGVGVVIGETCVIGDDVIIYQNVTLGGTGKEDGKRHPTIGNNVLIASGAKVLGSITIGENVKIGSNAVVLKDMPANSTVVGIPGKVVIYEGVRVRKSFDHSDVPDSLINYLARVEEELRELKKKVKELSEGSHGEKNKQADRR